MSCSYAALYGWRPRSPGSRSAAAANVRTMKSSWTGIGFSVHSVPSLSNTAIRSAGGM